MKLATFTHGGSSRIGVVGGDEIVDLGAAAPELPGELATLLAAGPEALAVARRAAEHPAARIPLNATPTLGRDTRVGGCC